MVSAAAKGSTRGVAFNHDYTVHDVAHYFSSEESRRGSEEDGFEEHPSMMTIKVEKLRCMLLC